MALGSSVAGVARVILEVDKRRAVRDMRGFENDLNGMASRGTKSLKGLATAYTGLASVGGVAALGLLFRKSIDAASDLNEEMTKAQTIFSGNGKEILRWSKTNADAFNLSQRAALQYASNVGAMLKTVGIAGDELDSMSEKLVQAGADMASFHNQDPSDMLDRLRSGLAGEAEPLRRFGILLSEAKVQQEAWSSGIAEQGAKLTEGEKVLARYNIIMREVGDAHGDVARTSGSLANQQRELTKNIENLEASLGRALLPVMQSVVTQLNDWAESLSENEELQQDLADAVQTAADEIKGFVEFADRVAGAMGGWEDASKFILTGLLATRIRGVATAIGVLLGSAGTGLLGGAAVGKGAKGGKAGTGLVGASGAAAGLEATLMRMAGTAFVISLVLQFVDAQTGGKVQDLADWEARQMEKLRRLHDWWQDFANPPGPADTTRRGTMPGGAFPGVQGGRTATGAIQLGTTQKTTHQTAGLGGYPALDWFAKPGTPVLAPERGAVVRHSGHPGTTSGQVYGSSLYYDGFDTGNSYYITHLMWVAPLGNYKRGDVIGRVSLWSDNPKSSHAHVGIRAGGAGRPRGTPTDTSGGVAGASTSTAAPRQAPSLEEQLARAQLTKTTADDLRIQRLIEKQLQRQIQAEKDTKKRAALLRELKQTRDEIADLEAGPGKRKVGRRASDVEDLPIGLRTLLADAEATDKNLTDDLRALDRIIAFLEAKLAKAKRGTERYLDILRSLNQFRSQRRGVEAELAERQAGKGGISGVAEVIGARPTGEGAAGPRKGAEEIQTKEGQEKLGKLLASLEPRKAEIRAWANALNDKKKAAVAQRKTLQAQLKKALAVRPKRLQSPTVIAGLRAHIKTLTDQIKELDDAIAEAFVMWGELEEEQRSEISKLAEEDEEARSKPPDRDTSGAGGGDFGGDTGGTDTPIGPTAAELQKQFSEVLAARSRFLEEFAPNVFTRTPFGLEFGSEPLSRAGGRAVVVNQYFQTPPADQHAYFNSAQFAAEHALG